MQKPFCLGKKKKEINVYNQMTGKEFSLISEELRRLGQVEQAWVLTPEACVQNTQRLQVIRS